MKVVEMKSLVLSLSANASTDRISVVKEFVAGTPSRTVYSFDQAGGSGAHATGVVQQLGGDARSVVALGSYNRDRWIAAARQQQMIFDYVDIGVPNRSTFVLIDQQKGNIAEVIDPGPQVREETAQDLLNCIEQYLEDSGVLILSGSLPPGVPPDFYSHAIRLARSYKVKVVVDASSDPLRYALDEVPWAIKPNLVEFHQLLGIETQTVEEHIKHLHSLIGVRAEVVLLSLGADGLLLGAGGNVWHLYIENHNMSLPDSRAINTVGCGDAFVGGFCYQLVQSSDILDSARWGVAAATATLSTYGVPSCPPELVQILVEKVKIVKAETSP